MPPSYTNGDHPSPYHPRSSADYYPGTPAQTLPVGTTPPPAAAGRTPVLSKSGSLDRDTRPPISPKPDTKGDRSDKKRHSYFGGLFKKKDKKEKDGK